MGTLARCCLIWLLLAGSAFGQVRPQKAALTNSTSYYLLGYEATNYFRLSPTDPLTNRTPYFSGGGLIGSGSDTIVERDWMGNIIRTLRRGQGAVEWIIYYGGDDHRAQKFYVRGPDDETNGHPNGHFIFSHTSFGNETVGVKFYPNDTEADFVNSTYVIELFTDVMTGGGYGLRSTNDLYAGLPGIIVGGPHWPLVLEGNPSVVAKSNVVFQTFLTLSETAAPGTPASGKVALYTKADGKLYIKDDAGTETDLTLGGAGGATAFDAIGDPSATALIDFGGTEQTLRSTANGINNGVLVISNTVADLTGFTALLRLYFNDGNDSDGYYLSMVGDVDGTPSIDYQFNQQTFTVGGNIASTFGGSLAVSSTIVHSGADQFKILTNAYSGLNVFLNLATNTMQFLLVTNNFTLILTNQNVGQRISFTMYNATATNCTITLPAVQIYGSGVSNVVVAAKRLKTAWESQDTAVTNVSAAFAQQKN